MNNWISKKHLMSIPRERGRKSAGNVLPSQLKWKKKVIPCFGITLTSLSTMQWQAIIPSIIEILVMHYVIYAKEMQINLNKSSQIYLHKIYICHTNSLFNRMNMGQKVQNVC